VLTISRWSALASRLLFVAAITTAATTRAGAQGGDNSVLSRLIAQAIGANPAIQAAQHRVDAARARVSPAGLPPDPMFMAGIQNVALGREPVTVSEHGTTGPGLPDPMTMKMVGVEQTLPYPGKLSLNRAAAMHDAESARASLDGARLQVTRDVEDAYFELAFVDQADSIVARNRDVLASLIGVTEARYGVGTSGQQDVLKARVEAARLAETATTLDARRRAALARLNATLDRSSNTPVDRPQIPDAIARAAVSNSPQDIHFASAALGAPAADSPLPSLAALQDMALRENPDLRAQNATIAAEAARVELARKAFLPDIDFTVQYGHRANGIPDMMTATVSVPIPIFKIRKQDAGVVEADAQLVALESDRAQKQNEVLADVARLDAALEQSRTQLALYVKALLPEARATLASATANYQVSRVDFLTVLDAQATVFNYETEYFRSLSDFARNLAELQRVVGREVLP
jgi:outer membrane protein, heavy metal efflux system